MGPDLDEFDDLGSATDETAGAGSEAAAIPVSGFTRFRVLTFTALGSLLIGYAAIAAVLALVSAIATKAQFTTVGVLIAALPSWLAAHQAPVSILGVELGVLPLLPTIGLVAITAKAASAAAERLDLRRPGQATPIVVTIAGAHGFAGVLIATLTSTEAVTVDPLTALYYPALVAGLAAIIGVARPCGLLAAVVDRADGAAVAGLRAGALAVVLLLVAGGAVLTFGLLMSIDTARALLPTGTGNAIGMLLLSIGYLPNAIVGATAFVAGPGFVLGDVVVSPLEFTGGPMPGIPLLAAMPEHQAAWWPALFVLPLTVGLVIGHRLRDADDDPIVRLRAVAVASGVVAMCFALLAGSAGGRLGQGAFDPVSMRAVAMSIALVLWTALPAAFTAWFGGLRSPTHLPGLLDDDDDHDDDRDHDEEHNESADDEPVVEEEPAGAEDDEPAVTPSPRAAADDDTDTDTDTDTPDEVPGPRAAVEESGEVARD